MNPQEEAQVAAYISTILVFTVPEVVAVIRDYPAPLWFMILNFALASWIGNKVYRHVIDDHLRLAYERAAQEKK